MAWHKKARTPQKPEMLYRTNAIAGECPYTTETVKLALPATIAERMTPASMVALLLGIRLWVDTVREYQSFPERNAGFQGNSLFFGNSQPNTAF
jgi:hypothetical protein